MRDKQIGLRLTNGELNDLDELVGFHIRATGRAWDRSSMLRLFIEKANEEKKRIESQEEDTEDD